MSMRVFAHRGSVDPSSGGQENTLAAFARAATLGADGVELDVRLTVDGALAVHHDPEIDTLGPVAALRLLDLPSWVPLLGQTLEACAGMTVNIEIKNLPTEAGFDPDEAVSGAVADLIVHLDLVDHVIVSSFWGPSLQAVRGVEPSIRTGLLMASWMSTDDGLAQAQDLGASAIHPHFSLVTPTLVTKAHQVGLEVATWTVNDQPTVWAMDAAGIDTVITDDISMALDARAEAEATTTGDQLPDP